MTRAHDELHVLHVALAAVARRTRIEIDREAYEMAGRDPRQPIFFAGNLDARVCIVGRDLGRDEVRHAQPLIGPSGRSVRAAVLDAVGERVSPTDPLLERALDHVLLTNLVPYKPRGNHPFPARVREAFRPFLERLLVCWFRGHRVLTLGNEAYTWFKRYAAKGELAKFERGARFTAELQCHMTARCGSSVVERLLVVCPLPHPSPANALYKAELAPMLARRLARAL